MQNPLSPFGTILVLLAALGAATLATWVITKADQWLESLIPRLKKAWLQWQADRALARAIKNAPRRSEEEVTAMKQGALEAIASFERSQQAMAVARH